MDTKDVAQKWAKMCREGNYLDCINALYADDVTSREMPGMPVPLIKGKKNVWNKSKQWLDTVEAFHSTEISDPLVADTHFTSKLSFDITIKDKGRKQMEEVAVFEVKDNKIVNEQFFYSI
jgi:hypothetical protein